MNVYEGMCLLIVTRVSRTVPRFFKIIPIQCLPRATTKAKRSHCAYLHRYVSR
jgi:hypothetical protein